MWSSCLKPTHSHLKFHTLSLVFVPFVVLGLGLGLGPDSKTDADGGAATVAAVSNYTKIESPCLCKEFRCDVGGGFCLHSAKVCNRIKDCPNNDDEDEFICRQTTSLKRSSTFVNNNKKDDDFCQQNEFKCKFGGCINITFVCDGIIHCPGATEEASDFCDYVNS